MDSLIRFVLVAVGIAIALAALLWLNLAHRPWVGVQDVKVRNNWPTQVDGKLRFDLSVELKNVGKSPAVVLRTAASAITSNEWSSAQKKRCNEARAEIQASDLYHWTVLPDQIWPYHAPAVTEKPLSEIRASGDDEIYVMIVGCVLYRSIFDDAIYATSFVARVSEEDQNDRKHIETRGAINPIRLNHLIDPPKDRLLIIKDVSMPGEPPR